MKRALLLAPLLLAGCLGQEGNQARYDQEMQRKEGEQKRMDDMEVFWTRRPDKPYKELGPIAVQTNRGSDEVMREIKRLVLDMGGDAAIITGSHSQGGVDGFVGFAQQPYTDAVAIKWK